MSQTYPPLDTATEAALRASVERFGVLVPIVVDQDGELLDGHHRSRIAVELGAECPARVHHVADDEERREIARTLNEDRRMLTREQRLPVVKALREEGHSYRAISGALGVSEKTAWEDARAEGVTPVTPEKTTGLDGKSYPATRPTKTLGGKSMPVLRSIETERQRQIAGAAKQRIERAVGTCNGIARGFDELNVESAVLAANEEEINGWLEALRDGTAAIKRLRIRIEEAR